MVAEILTSYFSRKVRYTLIFIKTMQAKHSMDTSKVQLWSAEDPNLYVLVLCLQETATGRILEYEACQVGFRTAYIQASRLLHNDKPIMIKGVHN